MAVHFHKCENQTLADKRLKGTTRDLYDLMLSMSHLQDHDLVISIAELAQGIMRTYETTRLHLKKLIRLGFVVRILRKDATRTKWNLKSRYVVFDIPSEPQPDVIEYFNQGRYPQIFGGGTPENLGGKDRERVTENIKDTLRRENESLPKEYTIEEAPKSSQQELIQAVPEIMRTTAEYLLLKTGRTSLKPKEVLSFHRPKRLPVSRKR